VLYVREMEKVLGSPADDSTNAFTARMLLLLESQPVYGQVLDASLLERIVSFYYGPRYLRRTRTQRVNSRH
jgi:hypothetical protein